MGVARLMARPTVTTPPITIILEIAGYGSLTEWLARPLPKEHVAALSPEAKRVRKRAQIRLSKLRARRVKAVANRDALTPTQSASGAKAGVLRDILRLIPVIIH
jgi:hypothetical protein